MSRRKVRRKVPVQQPRADETDPEEYDDRTVPRWMANSPAPTPTVTEDDEPDDRTVPRSMLDVMPEAAAPEEDHDDRTVPRWMALGAEDTVDVELSVQPRGSAGKVAGPAPSEPEGEAAEEPMDKTERVRRYRIRRSDGQYQFVTREELDALNVERKRRAAQHEADARRRGQVAIGIAQGFDHRS